MAAALGGAKSTRAVDVAPKAVEVLRKGKVVSFGGVVGLFPPWFVTFFFLCKFVV